MRWLPSRSARLWMKTSCLRKTSGKRWRALSLQRLDDDLDAGFSLGAINCIDTQLFERGATRGRHCITSIRAWVGVDHNCWGVQLVGR